MKEQKFTIKTQQAFQKAQERVSDLGQQFVEPIHILEATITEDKSIANFLYQRLGISAQQFETEVSDRTQTFSKVSGGTISLSPLGQQFVEKANKWSEKMEDEYISIEHLWLAATENNQTKSLFEKHNVTPKQMKEAINNLRGNRKANSHSAENNYQSLSKFATNLNERSLENKLDPVIGRDEEIRRVLEILSRRTKNNPVLVGEPGVGKTAIVEGLANRITEGDVPENLKGKTIYTLDMGMLIAGAKYKGEFEERLTSIVDEVSQSDGEIILFIDEIHTLIGAGKSEGAMDAANILKPALARGELRAIGATTLDEYQKYIESDKALERRFQRIQVAEPDVESTISILRGIKDRYEEHHKIFIKDEAIIAAVELSQRYITDRFLPDKAIDLVDEASAKLRININSKPQDLEQLDRGIMQLEIELEAIKKEKDKEKQSFIQKKLENLKSERVSINAQWQKEKEALDEVQQLKNEISQLELEASRLEKEGNFGKVAEIRYGSLKEKQELLETKEKELKSNQSQDRLIREEVTAEDIASVIAKWTGVPVERMLETEQKKLLEMETQLKKRMVGQEHAIRAVSDAVRRAKSGLQDPNKPLGSFLFLGSTGVGKTELAKTLAEYLFHQETAITRIDMSEYQEKHAVSRLIGSPPGYVGYEEGGQLTEAVRRKPYSIVLLDEIEKAHPDTFNILLQVLDEGRLTDSKGRVADFRNSIVIMTSNMGSDIIYDYMEELSNKDEELLKTIEEKIMQQLQKVVRPEFLNRIDEQLVFTPLNQEDIKEIVRLEIGKLKKILDAQKIELIVPEEVLDWAAKNGFDMQYGARPIKRWIQKNITNSVSKAILSGQVKPNGVASISVNQKEKKIEVLSPSMN